MGRKLRLPLWIPRSFSISNDPRRVVKSRLYNRLSWRVSRAEGVIKYDGNKGYAQSSGFRIQVFSDNDYRTAKNNALYKEGLIQQAFPELETYVTFTSPFWRLRVGDFRSYEEAGNALIQLKKEFPQMAREMRVVRDKIHIQIHQGFTE